jgi:hypothetical protein
MKIGSLVENHPYYHDWSMVGDFVHSERRGRITIVERRERCENCAKLRLTLIDVKRWEQIGRRRYRGNVKVIRLPKSEYLKTAWMKTTDWTKDDLARLAT